MNVIGIFPTPLVVIHHETNEKIYSFLNSPEMYPDSSVSYGNKSLNTRILSEPVCKPLSDFIIKSAAQVLNEILGLDSESVQITQSWVSHKNPGEMHQKHHHANSMISGVYYFQDSADKFPAITFWKNNTNGGCYEMTLPYVKETSDKPYSWNHFTYTPSKNDLILFPSYLQHSVDVNMTGEIRKSLAFNIMPTKSLGRVDSLTFMDFANLK